jgi:hypothetical protein
VKHPGVVAAGTAVGTEISYRIHAWRRGRRRDVSTLREVALTVDKGETPMQFLFRDSRRCRGANSLQRSAMAGAALLVPAAHA